jgi:hypothetical protein
LRSAIPGWRTCPAKFRACGTKEEAPPFIGVEIFEDEFEDD